MLKITGLTLIAIKSNVDKVVVDNLKPSLSKSKKINLIKSKILAELKNYINVKVMEFFISKAKAFSI